MLTSRNKRAEDALLRKWYDDISSGRSSDEWPGVTTLTGCLTKAYYQRTFLPQRPDRKTIMMFATGLWLEEVILGRDQNATSGSLNGIWYHTDNVKFELDGEPRLGEVKSTRSSLRHKNAEGKYVEKQYEELNHAWTRQFLSYLKGIGSTRGSAIILHLMGGYNPPFPDIRIHDIEATQEEIDDNWVWLRGRKYELDQALEHGIPPKEFEHRIVDWAGTADPSDPPEKQGYECDGCPFFTLCDSRAKGLL